MVTARGRDRGCGSRALDRDRQVTPAPKETGCGGERRRREQPRRGMPAPPREQVRSPCASCACHHDRGRAPRVSSSQSATITVTLVPALLRRSASASPRRRPAPRHPGARPQERSSRSVSLDSVTCFTTALVRLATFLIDWPTSLISCVLCSCTDVIATNRSIPYVFTRYTNMASPRRTGPAVRGRQRDGGARRRQRGYRRRGRGRARQPCGTPSRTRGADADAGHVRACRSSW